MGNNEDTTASLSDNRSKVQSLAEIECKFMCSNRNILLLMGRKKYTFLSNGI